MIHCGCEFELQIVAFQEPYGEQDLSSEAISTLIRRPRTTERMSGSAP